MSQLGQSAWCIELARPRERGLKPERGAERAAAERSGAALMQERPNSALSPVLVVAGAGGRRAEVARAVRA